jgi:FkbM family methyltransferase
MSFKDLAKKLFKSAGLEIKRIPKPGDQHIFGKMFHLRSTMKEALQQLSSCNYKPDIIIDVGTALGTAPLLEVFPDAYFFFIEPLKEFEKDINALLKKHSGKYICAAAGTTKGKIVLYVHPDKVGSSVYRETDGESADGIPREVAIFPLDDLAAELSLPKKILLKIDVQGAELDVLNGAEQLLKNCDAVILEVSFFKFLVDAPDFFEIVSFMKQKGFTVYDLFDGHNRPLDFALAQKDILFVKENGIFRQSHRWASDEQRLLLKNENY